MLPVQRWEKRPFLLLDIFSNDLKESARLNELVHLCALEAAATAQTGGGRDWREEGKAGGREALGEREREWGEEGGSTWAAVGRKPGGCAGSSREGWRVHKPPAVSGGPTWALFPGNSGGLSTGRGASGGGGGQSLLLNLPKWQHLRAQ